MRSSSEKKALSSSVMLSRPSTMMNTPHSAHAMSVRSSSIWSEFASATRVCSTARGSELPSTCTHASSPIWSLGSWFMRRRMRTGYRRSVGTSTFRGV